MFGRDWVDGEATIIDRRVTKTHTGASGLSYSDHEYVADVRVPGAAVFRTVIEDPDIQMDWLPPEAGQVVRVHVDLKRQKAKFDRDDPHLSADSLAQALETGDASFQAAVAAAPGTAPPDPEMEELMRLEAAEAPAAPGPPPADDPQARLQKLQQLKDSGLITEAEFAAKRQAIVDAL
jgi:hypothetical protein